MRDDIFIPRTLDPAIALGELILQAAALIIQQAGRPFRTRTGHPKGGRTLRPGRDTPLWNGLRAQVRRHLTQRGDQAALGRLVGLPRQRINAFVTRGSEMPDAERTLVLLAWLIALRDDSAPGLEYWKMKERRRRTGRDPKS